MPKKVKVPKIVFHFQDTPESKARLKKAYERIFDIARANIYKRRLLDKDKKID
ncbi:MAG: hypothetical protein ABIP54_01635 [Candidatus Andersenbacteria bacterium]